MIDADPQGSLTASLGYQEPDDIRYTLATIMMNIINEEEIDPMEGILHHEEGVDLVPANIELSGLEVSLSNVMSREMILKEYVEQIRDQYDYILIDCMPCRQGTDPGAGSLPAGQRPAAADQDCGGCEKAPE